MQLFTGYCFSIIIHIYMAARQKKGETKSQELKQTIKSVVKKEIPMGWDLQVRWCFQDQYLLWEILAWKPLAPLPSHHSIIWNAFQSDLLFRFGSVLSICCYLSPIFFLLAPQYAIEPAHQQNIPTNTAIKIKNRPCQLSWAIRYDLIVVH